MAVAIERGGALEGALGDHRVERVQDGIVRIDAGERGFAQSHRRSIAGADGVAAGAH